MCAAFGGLNKHQQFKDLKAGCEVRCLRLHWPRKPELHVGQAQLKVRLCSMHNLRLPCPEAPSLQVPVCTPGRGIGQLGSAAVTALTAALFPCHRLLRCRWQCAPPAA